MATITYHADYPAGATFLDLLGDDPLVGPPGGEVQSIVNNTGDSPFNGVEFVFELGPMDIFGNRPIIRLTISGSDKPFATIEPGTTGFGDGAEVIEGFLSLLGTMGPQAALAELLRNANELIGSDGDDTLVVSKPGDVVDAGSGDDSIELVASPATAIGGEGSDTITVAVAGKFAVFGGDSDGTAAAGFDLLRIAAAGVVFRTVSRIDGLVLVDPGGEGRTANFAAGQAKNGLARELAITGTGGEDKIVIVTSERPVRVTLKDWQFDSWSGRSRVVVEGRDRPSLALEEPVGKGAFSLKTDDRIVGSRVRDEISGNAGNDVIEGGRGKDLLFGNGGRDTVRGGPGDDLLNGGRGKDQLKGGKGEDVFLIDTLAPRSQDRILDFKPDVDRIHLDGDVFTAISSIRGGIFRLGSQAKDANDRLLFEADTGTLRYDPDGDGEAMAKTVAVLSGGVLLDHEDFLLV
jgi:Ca2+-binding RTX toxin-like protein